MARPRPVSCGGRNNVVNSLRKYSLDMTLIMIDLTETIDYR